VKLYQIYRMVNYSAIKSAKLNWLSTEKYLFIKLERNVKIHSTPH
jgi:hypothetical protein